MDLKLVGAAIRRDHGGGTPDRHCCNDEQQGKQPPCTTALRPSCSAPMMTHEISSWAMARIHRSRQTVGNREEFALEARILRATARGLIRLGEKTWGYSATQRAGAAADGRAPIVSRNSRHPSFTRSAVFVRGCGGELGKSIRVRRRARDTTSGRSTVVGNPDSVRGAEVITRDMSAWGLTNWILPPSERGGREPTDLTVIW